MSQLRKVEVHYHIYHKVAYSRSSQLAAPQSIEKAVYEIWNCALIFTLML
jgi:hypothetical protein